MDRPDECHDAIVIGAGPAGSVAGAYLAKHGLRTLILERERFPRFAIGESLLPYGNGILKELGVWPELERGGFVKKLGADFCTGQGERFNRFWFRQALGEDHAHTYQVERSRFDSLLLDAARRHGCSTLEGSTVSSVREIGTDAVELECDTPTGPRTLRTQWVVDAGGRRGIAGTALGFSRSPTRKRRMVAIYAHFRGVQRNAGEAAGHTVIVRIKDGWFWLIPLADGITSVGAVVSTATLRAAGGDLDAVFHRLACENSELQSRLCDAVKTIPLRATADYSWRFASFARNRVLLAGDAAGFVDPIFSSGVMLAMKSGRLAAMEIAEAHRTRRALSTAECRRYTRQVTSWMKLYGQVIQSFYERPGFEIFMHPMDFFRIPRSIGYLVGGRTDLSIIDRARIAAFRLVCILQRGLRIAPRIPSLR